jgi:hypothetical protein
MLTDDACERLISGRLTDCDSELSEVGWFLEDVRSLYSEPVPTAVKMLHPAALAGPARPALWPPEMVRTCKPSRSWWQLSAGASHVKGSGSTS